LKLDEELNRSQSIKARTIEREQKKKRKKEKRADVKYTKLLKKQYDILLGGVKLTL
jgi:hypothetical protein